MTSLRRHLGIVGTMLIVLVIPIVSSAYDDQDTHPRFEILISTIPLETRSGCCW